MSWVYTGIIGLVCGWIARFILPGNDNMGLIRTMLVGVAGAYVGAFLAKKAGLDARLKAGSWLTSVAGSVVILLILRMI
jgi:uncharacterized membrane protein YeaQ/YmgE (transglycosylase-associated protein family)